MRWPRRSRAAFHWCGSCARRWWSPPAPGGSSVESIEAAADALPSGATALVTTGHEELETLLERDDCRFVVRVIEAPEMRDAAACKADRCRGRPMALRTRSHCSGARGSRIW